MMCKCGHSRNEHCGGGAQQCLEDCYCEHYNPTDPEEEPYDADLDWHFSSQPGRENPPGGQK
jgi:hypothetical protein